MGVCSTAKAHGCGNQEGLQARAQMSRANGGAVSAVPTNVGVFFGQVDRRTKAWYWVGTQSEKLKEQSQGPFETKEQAVENAHQSLRQTGERLGRPPSVPRLA
jgi:hypothetical protein